MKELYAAEQKKQIDNNKLAMSLYNDMWKWIKHSKTRDLYEIATTGKSARYGVALQDCVLHLLGHSEAPSRKKFGAEARKWIKWMT